MRFFSFGALALLLLATRTGVRAQAPAPSPAPPPPPKIAVPNVFAYQPPPGWTAIQIPGAPFPTAVEPPTNTDPNHLKAVISINTDSAPANLTEWCNQAMAKNKAQFAALNAQVGELALFHTDNPVVTGFRAPVDLSARGRPIHYVMYFFAGNGATKITVTCACAGSEVDHYGPLFDSAMKTFVPY